MAGLQGRAFGGYQLVEHLPAGGIADVYRGRPSRPGGRDVVVKVVYPEFARQPGFLPRFRHIVQVSGKLASHPHILPLLAHGEDAGYLYLVTPFVEAGTLRDWQQKGGRMGLADAGPFFRQLCDALSYAHSLGVVHGNLKPSNVFLFEGRHVLLGDFGMLWDVSQMDMNHAGSGADAVEYLAPEVLGGQVTQLSDIYSLGAVLFSAVAGQAPFHGGKPAEVFSAHLQRAVPSLAQVTVAATAGTTVLDSVIQRAMAKRPEDRYASAAAVAQAIDVAARQAPAAPPSVAVHPVPGFTPFSASNPQGPHPQFAQPPISPPFGAAPIAPAFGSPMGSLVPPTGAAAAGAGMGGRPGVLPGRGGGLAQLDPPFPPLPASARVEEQMEQGRPQLRPTETGTQATIRVPAPAGPPVASADLPPQPTMRVPASNDSNASASRSGLTGLLESSPELPAISPSPASVPGQRSFHISGAPAARLRGLAGSAGLAGSPAFTSGDFDDDGDQQSAAHQMLPAVRPGSSDREPETYASMRGGFAVAGGGSASGGLREDDAIRDFDPQGAGQNDWRNDSAAFTSGESREWKVFEDSGEAAAAGWSDERFGEHTGYGTTYGRDGSGGFTEEQQERELDQRQSGPLQAAGDRPFSPTELGLPRLTSPVMSDQPPSFHDILSESGQLPGFGAGVAVGERRPTWADAGEGMWDGGGSAPLTPWRSNGASGRALSAGWAGEDSDAWARGSALPATTPTPWDSPAAGDVLADGKRGNNGKRGRLADADSDSGFDDERVWTVGTTAVRAGRRRWVRKVALVLLLVLLVDLVALVVARPDLCPNASCKQVNAYLHQKVPFLYGASSVAPPPLVAAPATLAFSVTSGKSGTIPLVIKNTGSADLSWKAAAALPWLAISPAAGTLGAGAPQALTLSAKPIGIKPGSYTSAVTVTTGKGALSVPVTIAVAAGALLTITPASLSFSSCGTAQSVSLTNSGAAPLTFTAVPSQTSALSLDTTSGSLGPGQSRAISVTLLCGATSGNEYTVNVISDSGSAVVTIHYT